MDHKAGRIVRIANPKYPKEYLDKIDAVCAGKEQVALFTAHSKEE